MGKAMGSGGRAYGGGAINELRRQAARSGVRISTAAARREAIRQLGGREEIQSLLSLRGRAVGFLDNGTPINARGLRRLLNGN